MFRKIGSELKKHVLTGISYMIPLVIAGAVIMAIARVGGSFFGITDIWDAKYADSANSLISLLHSLDGFGGLALGMMFPVIAAFIGYSIADKLALAPGLVGGLLARDIGAGFLGALAAGLIAGYTCLLIKKYVKLPKAAASIVPVFLVPVFGTLITILIINYVVGIPFADLNTALENWLNGMSGSNQILMAAIIGAMVGFDLGGPVNKAAVTTAMALLTSGIYAPNTAAQVAIIIPPLGLGLATLIAKRKYNTEMREAGKSSLIMGLVGISEGAIPFAVESPLKVIPATVLGSAVGGALAVGLGAINQAPISGFYGWFTVENWPVYILAIAVGTLIVAGMSVALRKASAGEEMAGSSYDDEIDEAEWEA
ncbi:PTS fructose transporter subunit IIC [Listeria monocytogenes]|uniref:PTS fructose transporter subunit IIC n=1 Tax=Listeria monocytogenes TaxID=1639 RepID=UPI0008745481|nr:PTS fructose transporter subunit IIC [Listeria monocytogenes]EAE0904753.1 PTS mannose transporter subunit IIAB [Listeria monocytogenes]EAE3603560.1 PTS mannose transporter subunit IIAB [Listeria monocytogenes]EAE3635075.1 PTS mannose transporter subunit IIAB [Listeria monocytogenes]EAE3641209.1 PTS mannose transporter subunit IIAB [Listeria monocytogenes]EAE3648013.1 PTS mannose transporter subunit IIAB [Listeria monocytogenes]